MKFLSKTAITMTAMPIPIGTSQRSTSLSLSSSMKPMSTRLLAGTGWREVVIYTKRIVGQTCLGKPCNSCVTCCPTVSDIGLNGSAWKYEKSTVLFLQNAELGLSGWGLPAIIVNYTIAYIEVASAGLCGAVDSV